MPGGPVNIFRANPHLLTHLAMNPVRSRANVCYP
jgi:hypothetical protein